MKVELDVEGLPAPPLPCDAPGRSGVPAKVDAEVKAEQDLVVKVETKTVEVKSSEIQPPRLATRAPVPPEGGVAAPATKRRWSGVPAPLGGNFCRRSRPWVSLQGDQPAAAPVGYIAASP